MVNKCVLAFIIFMSLTCIVSLVSAAPTTQAATLIGSNNATLNMVGGTNPMWYEWGMQSSTLSWRTVNSSIASQFVYGSPLLGDSIFYYRACDASGCGSILSFTTLSIPPQPQTTFSAGIDNITSSQYDIAVIAHESIQAYFWAVPSFPTIVWALLFFGIYIGLWIRERDLVVPVILGLITGSFVMFNDAGLQLGIPVEFQQIAQGLTYAALAGIMLSLIKRS